MAEVDDRIALAAQPPQFNFGNVLQQANQIRQGQAAADIAGNQALMSNLQTNALQNYMRAVQQGPGQGGTPSPGTPAGNALAGYGGGSNPGAQNALSQLAILDPQRGQQLMGLQARVNYAQTGDPNALRIDPAAFEQVSTAAKNMSDSQLTQFKTKSDWVGRVANATSAISDPQQRTAYFNQQLQDGYNQGLISPQELKQLWGNPSPLVLDQAMRRSMAVDKYFDVTGQSQANREANTSQVIPPGGALNVPPAVAAAQKNGPSLVTGSQLASNIAQSESGGNANAKSQTSTAAGPAQFTDGTWLQQMRQSRPDLAKLTDQQLLLLRNDKQLSSQATEDYAKTNAAALSQQGVPTTAANLALAHRFGASGAQTLLNANPQAKVSDVLPADVIKANPDLASQTVGDVIGKTQKQFGTATVDFGQNVEQNNGGPLIRQQTENGGAVVSNPNSPALINLNQGNVPKYLEDTGAAVAKYINDKQATLPGVQQSLTNIAELRHALQGVPTGPGTVNVNDASNFLSRFGLDMNKVLPQGWQTDPTKVNIAQKNITQLAAAYAKGEFPNRITNNDMQIAMQATPNLFNTEGANDHLLDNLESVQRLKLDEAKFYRQYAADVQKKGQVPDWTMIDAWNDHVKDMKGVPNTVKQAYLSYSDLPGASAEVQGSTGGGSTNLPVRGAVRSAVGQGGHTIYQVKGPEGYSWVDENGKPVQ